MPAGPSTLRFVMEPSPVAGAGMPPDVVALIEAAQRGDRKAFADLYLRFAAMVHGVLLSRIDRADVSDLVQDVFLQAMTSLGTLRDPQAFGGWLAALARNRATDHIRRRSRTIAMPEGLAEALPDTRIAAVPDRTDALAVLTAIRTLPDAYRETLILRLVEGMTGPEIAVSTGLTPGSVRVNLYRGMKLLRERLQGSAAHE